jgi:adenylyltransferase/sulfurtransferase
MEGRYARQEALSFVGKSGQRRLSSASVAVVGCGGLGSVAAELLARAGIGRMNLIDNDVVELSNLQRQSLYTEKDLDKKKALCLAKHLKGINSTITVSAKPVKMGVKNVNALLKDSDLVLDCTDNIDTRLVINDFCAGNGIPWVHASAAGTAGFILSIVPGSPCFRCAFPKAAKGVSCREVGILGSTAHIIASFQVAEAIKLLLGKAREQDLMRIDILSFDMKKISVKKDLSCIACGRKVRR